MSPASVSGHCRVTVVAPTTRVDVALPEDIPLAELLPDVLRLVGEPSVGGADPTPGTAASPGSGYSSGHGFSSTFGYGSSSGFGSAATTSLSGYVLIGSGGRVLDTSQSLNAQGVLHGELLRLRS